MLNNKPKTAENVHKYSCQKIGFGFAVLNCNLKRLYGLFIMKHVLQI
jgi:hypothetical protein